MMTLEQKRENELWCDYCEAGIERMASLFPSVNPFVGDRIRARRKEAGMTQGDLVSMMKASEMKSWTTAKVSQVENGGRKVTVEELWILALIFGCSVGDFFPEPAGLTPGLHPEATERGSYRSNGGCPAHAGRRRGEEAPPA